MSPSRNLIARGDQEVRIEPRAMDLLVCLARRAGQVVSIDELIAEVWDGAVVTDSSVYLLINRLRQAMDDGTHEQIETIRKRGYRLNAPVHWPEHSEDHGTDAGGARPRWVGGALAAIGLAALAWVLVDTGTTEGGAAGQQRPFGDSPEVAMAMQRIFTSTSLDESLAILDSTPQIDPAHPAAKALRAFLHSMSLVDTAMAQAVAISDIDETSALIEKLAAEALTEDPNQSMALAALGNKSFFEWRWAEAEDYFQEALDITGSVSPAVAAYVFLSFYIGDHERAIELSERMTRSEPNNPLYSAVLALALADDGQFEAAVDKLEHIVETFPWFDIGHAYLVRVHLALDNRSDAMRHAEHLPADPYRLMLIGRQAEARREAENLLRRDSDGNIRLKLGQRVKAYLVLGDKDSALAWLEVAADKAARHEPEPSFYELMTLKMNIVGNETLNEPAFADVLSRIHGD